MARKMVVAVVVRKGIDFSTPCSYIQPIDRKMVKKMARYATLSAKFQISIPKSVREEQHWTAGQKLVFIPKGSGVLLVPVPAQAELFGIAEGANPNDYRDRNDRV